MKGIVFTEFLELVENKFSLEIADRIIAKADLPSGGAYNSLGTYDHEEILKLVANLSEETKIPAPNLIKVFGQHLAGRFHEGFPQFFENTADLFDFLKHVDDYIHVEVKKLYPDAELPVIECETPSPDQLIFVYSSRRPFGDLAEGLLNGVIQIYGVAVNLERENLPCEEGAKVKFTMTKTGELAEKTAAQLSSVAEQDQAIKSDIPKSEHNKIELLHAELKRDLESVRKEIAELKTNLTRVIVLVVAGFALLQTSLIVVLLKLADKI